MAFVTAEFRPGPNLTARELVTARMTRLTALNKRLAECGIIPQLAVITTRYIDPGITSYNKGLNNMAPAIGSEVVVCNSPDDATALRRVHEYNERPGATLVMVPLKDRDREPELLAANKREIEGLQAGSKYSPSTPQAMWDLAVHAVGRELDELDDPDASIALIGTGASVGKPLHGMFQQAGISPLVIGRENPEAYAELPRRTLIFSGVGKAGLLGAAQFGPPPSEGSKRFAIDAGVSRIDGRVCGDIDPRVEGAVPDLMFNPPYGAVGALNRLNIFERLTEETIAYYNLGASLEQPLAPIALVA